MTETTATEVKAELLPLDVKRTLTLRFGHHRITYKFRRILNQDWEKCFLGQFHETRQTGHGREQIFERETAMLNLVTATVEAVEGYAGDVTALKDWRNSLPIGHRMAFATTLAEVVPDRDEDSEFTLSDLVTVKLQALWSSTPDGMTNVITGLVHRFRQPSIEQLQKFQRQLARVMVSAGGTTRYPSRAAVGMKLYDELIESVAGYSVGGVEITSREDAIAHMDGAHKAEAALNLFATPEAPSLEAGGGSVDE